jgi:hypothetical protein
LKKNPNLNVLYQAFKHQYGKSGVTVLTQQVVRIFQEKTEHDKCEKFLNFVINMLNWTQIGFQDSIHIKEVKLSKWIEVLEDDRMSDPTRGYFPEDLAPLLSQANLVDFQYAPESQLVCDLNIPSPHSMYAPYYKERLNVWEAVFAKPETFPDGMCPAAHYQAALLASQEPVYLSNASTPALSNGVTMNSYPPTLLAYAEEKAKHLGGRNHLKWLVEALTQQSQSETEKATALITFVQRAIYRDPISQPLTQDGQLPEAEVILQTHRGRCGHAVKLLSALFEIAGIEHETIQYPRHVALKAKVNGRWVLAETDAFKHGILPKGSDGQLLTMDELKANPRLLDRYPMTGWASLPNSPQSQDAFGHQVTGYIGAETFEQRGFLSGYFDETLIDFPPSLPEIQSADIVSRTPEGVQINLNWTPSQCLGEPLAYYGVTIGSHSRGWDYATPSTFNLVSTILPADCLKLETNETSLSVFIPQNKLNDLKDNTLFISITAFGSRIMQDPQTFYWPSDEYGLTLPQL